MKYMLLLMLCSTVENTCYKPVHYPDLFNDNYTCLIKGYNESIKQIQDIGRNNINELNLSYKFACIEVEKIHKDT